MPAARIPAGDELLGLLCCPRTGQHLNREGDELVSEDGSRRYPSASGLPVLIDDEHSLFSTADYLTTPPPPSISRAQRSLGQLLPSISKNHRAAANYRRMAELLEAVAERRGTPAQVLVVGGSIAGVGFEELLNAPHVELVETDVSVGPRTLVICDIVALPFPDEGFDAVVCQGVLMLVPDVEKAVSEMHRVLRPEGLIYSEVAFLARNCEGSLDHHRWTLLGHRRLLRRFDVLAAGVQCGPGMALAWTFRAYLLTWARTPVSRALLGALAHYLTFWLPRLDRRLLDRPRAVDGALGTFILGRKRQDPVPDAEIVASYRGAGGGFVRYR